ncbi:hypothetical protein K1719_042440 [Acacia pycnantha]|nr:hypothetical protein K1719_042440 [Acacia pycnantha]
MVEFAQNGETSLSAALMMINSLTTSPPNLLCDGSITFIDAALNHVSCRCGMLLILGNAYKFLLMSRDTRWTMTPDEGPIGVPLAGNLP